MTRTIPIKTRATTTTGGLTSTTTETWMGFARSTITASACSIRLYKSPTCSRTSILPPPTGFANYMFQTNEGPSFPAHQFLFTGTSAPTAPNDPNNYYLNFIAENADMFSSGCAQNTYQANWVDPTGTESPGPIECYPHDSLV